MTLQTIRLGTHDTNLGNQIQTKHITKNYDFMTKRFDNQFCLLHLYKYEYLLGYKVENDLFDT